MKFFKQDPVYPPNGALRQDSWFAWLPVTIDKETRWLEKVVVEFEYWEGYGAFAEPMWLCKRFLN